MVSWINSGLNLGANVSCQDVSGKGRAGVTDADAAGAFNLTLTSRQQTRNLAEGLMPHHQSVMDQMYLVR